jgi:mono/diheme cytochrome c family protein
MGAIERSLILSLLGAVFTAGPSIAAPVDQPSAVQVQFFETRIRPVLMDRCYACHSSQGEKIRGGLVLETRAGVLRGGDDGVVVVPGDVEASLLIKAIRYTDPKLKMPPKAEHRLSAEQVADFEKWVAMGVPDPRVGATGADAPATAEVSSPPPVPPAGFTVIVTVAGGAVAAPSPPGLVYWSLATKPASGG